MTALAPTSAEPTGTLPPLKHAWKQCACIGMALEVLRDDMQEQLRRVQREIGYRHIRFHASFHDRLGVVRRAADGSVNYHWALFDKVYDFLVEIGFDPIIELNPMPAAIASGDQLMFDSGWGFNVTPPRSWDLWEDLCRACAAHVVERYGLPRVKNWMFECWNEPNLHGQFWTGTDEEYYQLYAASARGIKSVDPELKVGGPACAGAEMPLPFAKWCRENHVPLDFLSYHGYPMGEYGEYPQRVGSPHEPGFAMVNDFRKAHEELHAEGFGDLPRIITEWNVQHCDEHGNSKWVGTSDCTRLFSGAAALHYTLECEPYVDAFGYWTLSDIFHEAGITQQEFGTNNQYYGMITIEGRPKPVYHAFKYLARMTGPRLRPSESVVADKPPLANLVITDETVTCRALMWNFHMPEDPSRAWEGTLDLPLPESMQDAERVRVVTAQITESSGGVYEAWQAMDGPPSFTRLESEAIEAASHPQHQALILENHDGKVAVPYRLERNEVLFIELSGPTGNSAEAVSDALNKLNHQLEYPGSKKLRS
ncbi:MAG: hypothetical protein AAGI68_04685 [Planctomycetota bacterium]